MAEEAVSKYGVSIALACRTFQFSETCYRHERKLSDDNAEIADWLMRLTANRRSWGFDLCFLYLRNVKGFNWYHERVYRIYCELELSQTCRSSVVSRSSPDLKCWLCKTSSIRPLKRATIPLACGDFGGVRRGSMSSSAQSRLNACSPVAERLRRPKKRSVKSFPLSVKIVRIRIGQALPKSRKNRRALAAVLVLQMTYLR